MTYTFKTLDLGHVKRIMAAKEKAAAQAALARQQREAKAKRGRPPNQQLGPQTIEFIKATHRDLTQNYPHGIFKEIAREFQPDSKAKYARIGAYFHNPGRFSITVWHRLFKAIAAVKARY